MAWTPLLLVLLSHCTGRDGPQGPGFSSQVILFLLHLLRSFLWFCPITDTSLCCRFPVPACADSATLPLCISWSISQTHLHPQQWLQCGQLWYTVAPAEAREPSPVSPGIQLRFTKTSRLRGPQPLLWIQRRLGQRRAPDHLRASARGRGRLLLCYSSWQWEQLQSLTVAQMMRK